MFASSTISIHIARGAVAALAIAGVAAILGGQPGALGAVAALALAAVAVAALGGCPACWTIGLIEAVARRRSLPSAGAERTCGSGRCPESRETGGCDR